MRHRWHIGLAPFETVLRKRYPTPWRMAGLLAGLASGTLLLVFFNYPERNSLVAKGPMNTGHEELDCEQCHIPIEGTAAEHVSANVYYWLGLRKQSAGFGSRDVGSRECLGCHERPDDRHPVSRFLEPRFAEARKHIKAYECITCHTEHQGKRVTLPTIGYCMRCHQDTELQNDPILPTHGDIIRNEFWTSCLQCHDFHGNHRMTTPVRLEDGVSEDEVWRYFEGGPSPYSSEKYVEPSRTRRGDGQ